MTKTLSLVLAAVLLLSTGCSTRKTSSYSGGKYTGSSGAKKSSKTRTYNKATMRPYTVHGKRYYPTVVNVGETFHGTASWYGPKFHGRKTSNGETYDMHEMTAAHKTLPMNTILRVRHKRNGKIAIVRINDRGPFVGNRIIDLSNAAARKIDMVGTGTAPVELTVLGFEKDGSRTISDLATLKKGPDSKIVESYSVQIGSFSRIEGAITTQEKYDNTDGYKTVIKDTGEGDDRLFRVWLTGFKSEQEARDFKDSGKFQGAFIVGG
jgi:rare lipoprotein A